MSYLTLGVRDGGALGREIVAEGCSSWGLYEADAGARSSVDIC